MFSPPGKVSVCIHCQKCHIFRTSEIKSWPCGVPDLILLGEMTTQLFKSHKTKTNGIPTYAHSSLNSGVGQHECVHRCEGVESNKLSIYKTVFASGESGKNDKTT